MNVAFASFRSIGKSANSPQTITNTQVSMIENLVSDLQAENTVYKSSSEKLTNSIDEVLIANEKLNSVILYRRKLLNSIKSNLKEIKNRTPQSSGLKRKAFQRLTKYQKYFKKKTNGIGLDKINDEVCYLMDKIELVKNDLEQYRQKKDNNENSVHHLLLLFKLREELEAMNIRLKSESSKYIQKINEKQLDLDPTLQNRINTVKLKMEETERIRLQLHLENQNYYGKINIDENNYEDLNKKLEKVALILKQLDDFIASCSNFQTLSLESSIINPDKPIQSDSTFKNMPKFKSDVHFTSIYGSGNPPNPNEIVHDELASDSLIEDIENQKKKRNDNSKSSKEKPIIVRPEIAFALSKGNKKLKNSTQVGVNENMDSAKSTPAIDHFELNQLAPMPLSEFDAQIIKKKNNHSKIIVKPNQSLKDEIQQKNLKMNKRSKDYLNKNSCEIESSELSQSIKNKQVKKEMDDSNEIKSKNRIETIQSKQNRNKNKHFVEMFKETERKRSHSLIYQSKPIMINLTSQKRSKSDNEIDENYPNFERDVSKKKKKKKDNTDTEADDDNFTESSIDSSVLLALNKKKELPNQKERNIDKSKSSKKPRKAKKKGTTKTGETDNDVLSIKKSRKYQENQSSTDDEVVLSNDTVYASKNDKTKKKRNGSNHFVDDGINERDLKKGLKKESKDKTKMKKKDKEYDESEDESQNIKDLSKKRKKKKSRKNNELKTCNDDSSDANNKSSTKLKQKSSQIEKQLEQSSSDGKEAIVGSKKRKQSTHVSKSDISDHSEYDYDEISQDTNKQYYLKVKRKINIGNKNPYFTHESKNPWVIHGDTTTDYSSSDENDTENHDKSNQNHNNETNRVEFTQSPIKRFSVHNSPDSSEKFNTIMNKLREKLPTDNPLNSTSSLFQGNQTLNSNHSPSKRVMSHSKSSDVFDSPSVKIQNIDDLFPSSAYLNNNKLYQTEATNNLFINQETIDDSNPFANEFRSSSPISSTQWANKLLREKIVQHVNNAHIEIAISEAQYQIAQLDNEITDLQDQYSLLSLEIRQKEHPTFHIINPVMKLFIPGSVSIINQNEKHSCAFQTTLTGQMIIDAETEINDNNAYLAKESIYESEKMMNDMYLPKLETALDNILKRNDQLDTLIEQYESRLGIGEGNNKNNKITKEAKLRQRFEQHIQDAKKKYVELDETIVSSFKELEKTKEMIKDQRELHGLIKEQIAIERKADKPNVPQMQKTLEGYKAIEKWSNEKITMMQIEQKYLDSRIKERQKISELIDNLEKENQENYLYLKSLKQHFIAVLNETENKNDTDLKENLGDADDLDNLLNQFKHFSTPSEMKMLERITTTLISDIEIQKSKERKFIGLIKAAAKKLVNYKVNVPPNSHIDLSVYN